MPDARNTGISNRSVMAMDFLLIGNGCDGSMLAGLDAFLATDAIIGVLDINVLVNTEA